MTGACTKSLTAHLVSSFLRFLGAGGASGVRASKQRASIFLPPPPGRRRLALRNNKQQTCDQTHLVHSTTPRETNTVSFLCSYQQKKAYSRSRKLDFIPEDPASAKHHQPATALHRKTLSPPHITTLSNNPPNPGSSALFHSEATLLLI